MISNESAFECTTVVADALKPMAKPEPNITVEHFQRFAAVAPRNWKVMLDPRGNAMDITVLGRRTTFGVFIRHWSLYPRMAFAGLIFGWLGRGFDVRSGTEPVGDEAGRHEHIVTASGSQGEFTGRGSTLGEACFFVALEVLEGKANPDMPEVPDAG